jgi:tRNA-binding protein
LIRFLPLIELKYKVSVKVKKFRGSIPIFIFKFLKIKVMLTWEEFEKVEMRVGTIIEVNDFLEARKPAYQLRIDFGQIIGIKKTSAQITKRYLKDELLGKQIIAVVNFPTKQIGKFNSECLILGSIGDENDIVLLSTDKKVENGLRVG